MIIAIKKAINLFEMESGLLIVFGRILGIWIRSLRRYAFSSEIVESKGKTLPRIAYNWYGTSHKFVLGQLEVPEGISNMYSIHGSRRGLSGLDLIFTLCGIALLVGAVLLVVKFTIPIMQESFASSSWPTTNGKIVESRIKLKQSPGKKSSTQSIIKYLYTANGVELLGERVKVDESFEKDTAIKSRYPTGKSVQVYYDSKAPWRSVLEPGFEFGLSIFFPLVMIILGVLFSLLPSFIARKKKKALAEGAELPKSRGKVMGGFLIAFGVVSVVFAVVIGLIVMVALGGNSKKTMDVSSWLPVSGSVVESGFVETDEKKTKTWAGQIEYRYVQDGVEYTSSQYGFGLGGELRPDGEAVYQNRPDNSVTIYVDPKNPANAVFTTSPKQEAWGAYSIFMLVPTCMVICGLVFVGVGLVTVLRA